MNENSESVFNSFKQFLQSYDSDKSGLNSKSGSEVTPQTQEVLDLSSNQLQTVVMRNRQTSDSCLFADHTISAHDVEPELFDWIFYHLDYKKCPHPLAFALASIVARKLGLAETTRESHSSDADKSKPAISSNELYSQSLEYLTEYINSWKENPELAVEIAKEYSDQKFVSSICAIKNSRRKMEDRHVVLHDLNKALNLKVKKQYSYYAIFDGHAGVDAASYSSAHLHYNLVKSQAFLDGDIAGAFKEAFSLTDLYYLERSAREGKKSGSTALCALLEDKTKVYIAWLGDSQAVIVKNGKPIDIMIPHKPELEEERKRIEELGGFVAYVDTWRVNGTLAVSRAIGDPEHKPFISSEPDIVAIDLDADSDFLVLACDGLWDQLTPEEVTTLVYQYICEHEDENTQQIAANMASHLSKVAKDDGSSDNITTIVLFFKDVDQLKATPFEPLTPRERSLTGEVQPNGGLNGNHFQYNESDSQFDFMQNNTNNANNPFDSSADNRVQSWSTGSSFDVMNNAKLNFEISDSIDSSNNESKDNSNPFNTNDYSYVDLSNENKVENNMFDTSDKNEFNNNESNRMIESFEAKDKLESTRVESIDNNSNPNEHQSDSQFNISKLSDISTSFPTGAAIDLEERVCSTPLQTQTSEPFSINSVSQENIVLETNMDSIDASEDFSSFRLNYSESNVKTVEQTGDQNDLIDNSDSLLSIKSDSNESYFDKSGRQTVFETIDTIDMTIESPVKLEDVCEQVFKDVDESNAIYNPNQDLHDFSSGAESVDSIVYENIGTDLSEVTNKVIQNDYPFSEQHHLSLIPESEPQMAFEESKEEVLKSHDLIANDTNAELIAEALAAEHLSPDEIAEVVQQLATTDTRSEFGVKPDQPIDLETAIEDLIPEEPVLLQSSPQPIDEQMISEEPVLSPSSSQIIEEQLITEEPVLLPSSPQPIEEQLIPEEPVLLPSSPQPIEEQLISEELVLLPSSPQPIEEQLISEEPVLSTSSPQPIEEQLTSEEPVLLPSSPQPIEEQLISEEQVLLPSSPQPIEDQLISEETIGLRMDFNEFQTEIQTEESVLENLNFENLKLESTAEDLTSGLQLLSEDSEPKPMIEIISEEIKSDLLAEESISLQIISDELSFEAKPEESVEPEVETLVEAVDPEIGFETSKPEPQLMSEINSEEFSFELKSEECIRPQFAEEVKFEPSGDDWTETIVERTVEHVLSSPLSTDKMAQNFDYEELIPTEEPLFDLKSEQTVEQTLSNDLTNEFRTEELISESKPNESLINGFAEQDLNTELNFNNEIPITEISKPEIVSELDPNSVIIDNSATLLNQSNGGDNGLKIIESIESKDKVQEVVKTTKVLNSKISPNKALKTLAKAEPKAKDKPLVTSSLSAKSPTKPTSKVTVGSKLSTKTSSSALTKPSTGAPIRSTNTSKPIGDKTAQKPLTTMRPKPAATASAPKLATASALKPATASAPKPATASALKPATASAPKPATASAPKPATTASVPKTSATAKPPTRVTPALRLATAPAKPASTTSKVSPSKPLEIKTTRAPIASRTATTSTTLRTTLTNGKTSSTSGSAQTKSTLTSQTTRKTTTTALKPTQSMANNAKPVSARVPATSGAKPVPSRPNTGRPSPTASGSAKTSVDKSKSNTSLLQSKTSVKPISLKGENKVTAVPKPNSIAPKTNGITPSMAPSMRTIESKNNLKVANSLKQELEDADSLAQPLATDTLRKDLSTPDSEGNFMAPDALDAGPISEANLTRTDPLCLNLSSDFNANN